jgi:hypothetical protein
MPPVSKAELYAAIRRDARAGTSLHRLPSHRVGVDSPHATAAASSMMAHRPQHK